MTVTPLRVAHRRPGRNLAAAERAAAAFLDGRAEFFTLAGL
jgi:hypothetical protein